MSHQSVQRRGVRGSNGYASACIVGLSRPALGSGALARMLHTNLANPTSNKIYQAIGYRPVGDNRGWHFGSERSR